MAAPDKLGIRCSGRLTVRPCPPEDAVEHTFEIGAQVDAWWCDGWWESVITAINVCGVDTLQVYSPGKVIYMYNISCFLLFSAILMSLQRTAYELNEW